MISIDDKFYCPKCHNELERLDGCGAVGYMCNSCKRLISRKEMLSIDDMENSRNKVANEKGNEKNPGL